MAPDAPQKTLESGMVELFFVKLAMLLDQIVQNVDACFRVRYSSHQCCHRAWEKRYRKEELLLAPPELLQGHGAVLEGLQIPIAPDARFLQGALGATGHASGTRFFAGFHISELLIFQTPALSPVP